MTPSDNLRDQLCYWHKYIHEHGLVTWTQGNISVRHPDDSHIYIKASGVPYVGMIPRYMLRVEMDGDYSDKDFRPSTDTASHLYIYNRMPSVRAIIHTHSTFATTFAACGEDIPCHLTAMADVFGEDIPCAGYAEIGGEEIGEAVVGCIGKAGVVLLRNHGLFAVGSTIEDAVKRAVITEDSAQTLYYAMSSDSFELRFLSPRQIDYNYERYRGYGQPR